MPINFLLVTAITYFHPLRLFPAKMIVVGAHYLRFMRKKKNMFAIIGALIFLIMAITTLPVALVFPLSELTMGGQYTVLPSRFRVMARVSLLIQVFAITIVLQAGGIVPLIFSVHVPRFVWYVFAGYLTLDTVMNLSSKSKKERFAMTPLPVFAFL